MEIWLSIIVRGFMAFAAFALGKPYVRGETMSVQEVCKKWGATEFNLDKFRNADEATKASMTCDLLKKQKAYSGKSIAEIKEKFGKVSGYYFSDYYVTYLIQSGKSKNEDTWQILFLIDKDRKISEITVHKNCCER